TLRMSSAPATAFHQRRSRTSSRYRSFHSRRGRTPHKSDFERRVSHEVLAKAGLHLIRFHDLRHTYASRLLQNGESVVYVKEQLGHSSIQVTVDTYGHLVPGADRAAVNRLDQTDSSTAHTPAE